MEKQVKSNWYVYILECADGTYYTGITTDTERRVREHNNSDLRAARYTRMRRPVILVYHEKVSGRAEALKREYMIKKMDRSGKKKLIRSLFDNNQIAKKNPDS